MSGIQVSWVGSSPQSKSHFTPYLVPPSSGPNQHPRLTNYLNMSIIDFRQEMNQLVNLIEEIAESETFNAGESKDIQTTSNKLQVCFSKFTEASFNQDTDEEEYIELYYVFNWFDTICGNHFDLDESIKSCLRYSFVSQLQDNIDMSKYFSKRFIDDFKYLETLDDASDEYDLKFIFTENVNDELCNILFEYQDENYLNMKMEDVFKLVYITMLEYVFETYINP